MARIKQIPRRIVPKESEVITRFTDQTSRSVKKSGLPKPTETETGDYVSQWLLSETGEIQIREDINGVYTLDGEELNFSSWGKITNSDSSDIVSVLDKYANQPQPRSKNEKYYDYTKYKKKQYEKRMGYKKLKLMDKVRKEMEEYDKTEVLKLIHEQDKSLDEGEIESDSEDECNKKTPWDTASSESDSIMEISSNSRKRRSRQRAQKNTHTRYNDQTLSQFFFYRHKLLMTLPLSQKKEFLDILQKVCRN